MTSAKSKYSASKVNDGLLDGAAPLSTEALDLPTTQSLRQLQRNFILEEPSIDHLIETFPSLLSSASRADKNLEWQLASLDALSIWLLRATRSSNVSNISSHIKSSDWESLVSLAWIRWASAPNSNAVQKVLKELFFKVLVLQRMLFQDWKEREVQLLKKVANFREMDRKIQCYLIEVLVRRVSDGGKRVLEIRNNWVMEMLGEMKDGSIGPAVGKCLVNVLMVRRTELINESENGHSVWLEIWKGPLLQTISGSEESHVRLLNKYFLPTLSKECPHAFTDLLQSMAIDILEKKQTSGLQALMLCLNIARREKLLPDDPILAFADMGLPSTFFPSLLTNSSATIRVAAFDLLTFHTHQKTPLSKDCFTLIQSVLPSLFAEQDAEFRGEILRSIRGLILRIRASTHAASKELERRTSRLGNATAELTQIIENASQFIKWLVSFCGECITPGRSYYTASMGLRTLHVISEEGFFIDLDVEVKSGVLSGVHMELFSKGMLRLLLDRLADAYDEVARMACWLVERIKEPEMIPWKNLYFTGRKLCLSGRADKSEGGARVLHLCQRFCAINGYTNIWEEVWESLVEDIKSGDVQNVAIEKPLHGRLVALRSLPRAEHVVDRVLQLCQDIWDLVSPILTHDSPEGNLHFTSDTSALRDASAQDILSSSWRSLKEASALLGTVLSTLPSTFEDFKSAGGLFMEWLSRIRHRGAFSAVMPAFEGLCSECFNDTQKNLKTLPAQWLNECLLSMTSTTRSITRRSGGLPMLISAVLVAEADVQSFELTKLALSQLLALAETPLDMSGTQGTEPAKWDLPQVHAQNAMRAIFMEPKLATTTFGYVESAFAIAIKGFSSDVYPIRNSSIMLFDSLLFRAMGQKYARQDIDPSAPNRSVSSQVFFSKFPKLHKYLLDELTLDVSLLKNNEDIVNTGLYPILTLLSRLDVARLSDSRKYTGMHPFRPLIQQCMRGKIWKVRSMAARCLPAVLDPDALSEEIPTMFAKFRLGSQNELHGGLMGIKRICEFYSYRALKDIVFDAIISGMEKSFEAVLRENPNPLTKSAYLEIVHLFEKEEKAKRLRDLVFPSCRNDISRVFTSVGWQMYLEQATSIVLKTIKGTEDDGYILESLLRNKNEEVVLKTLSWMNDSDIEYPSRVRTALHDLVFQNKWDGVCGLALQAMSSLNDEEMSLVECLCGFERSEVMPVNEGWLRLAGSAARIEYPKEKRETWSHYFDVLSISAQPSSPESTRLGALESLRSFSPVLAEALQSRTPSGQLLPAFIMLFHFLSDDDNDIRNLASEITSSVLGEHMVFTPMTASEMLAHTIADAFDPETTEKNIVEILCQAKLREQLHYSPEILFAKERENKWRDEIYQWGLYIRVLSMCWSRQMSLEMKPQGLVIEKWVTDGISAIKEIVEKEDDMALGWSHDIDVFETIIKVFLLVEALLRYGRGGGNLIGVLEELNSTMIKRNCHEYLIEKIGQIIVCSVGVQKRITPE